MRLVILLITLTACSATARLGETPEQITQRYGPPMQGMLVTDELRFKLVACDSGFQDGMATTNYFFKSNYVVTVSFLHGKSVRETINAKPNSHQTITDEEKLMMRDSIAPGLRWQGETGHWRTAEGFTADSFILQSFNIESVAYKRQRDAHWELEKQKAAEEARKKTDGF